MKVYAEQYSDFLVKCFKQLPLQIPLLATMLALLSVDEREFVALTINKLQVALAAAIEEDEVLTVKMLLRSIACLASSSCWAVDGAGGLISVLAPFLAAVEAALQNDNNLDEQSLVSFFLLAQTIIWCPEALSSVAIGQAMLDRIYAAFTAFPSAYRSPFAVNGRMAVVNKYFPPEDGAVACIGVVPAADDARYGGCSDSLWAAVAIAHDALSEMRGNGGLTFPFPGCMITPWRRLITPDHALVTMSTEDRLRGSPELEERLFTLLQHKSLGARCRRGVVSGLVTFVHGDGLGGAGRTRGGWCHNRFAVFTADVNEDTAACAALPLLQRGLAMSYFEEILTFFEPTACQDGTKYGSLDLLVSHLISTIGLFPPGSHLEYILVEVLVQGMLQQPGNKAHHQYLCRVILHLCKKAADAVIKVQQVAQPTEEAEVKTGEVVLSNILSVVGLAANTIFQLLPDLDHAAARAFADWFSFQLINSQLAWPAWDYWLTESGLAGENLGGVDDEGVLTLTRLVVHNIAQQCSLLVPAERLKVALPAQLHAFFDYDETPKCSLFPDNTRTDAISSAVETIHRHAFELKKMVEERLDGEEVLDWMENLPQLSLEGNEKLLGAMFIQAMGIVGHQAETLTAFVGLMDTYGPNVLQELGQSEEQHYVLAKALFDVYSHHSGLAAFLFDELLRRGLVHVSAVALLLSEEQVLRALINEPLAYRLFEMVIDRALDFVRASVLERHRLSAGAVSVILDETADLTPQDEPVYLPIPITSDAMDARQAGVAMEGAETTLRESSNTRTDNAVSIAPQPKSEEEDVQVDYDEDQDEDGDGRRVRRRVDEDSSAPRTVPKPYIPEVPREVDPLWVADEAWKSALRGSRGTYALVISTLLRAWSNDIAMAAGEREALKLIAKSLLNRVWRGYHGLQSHLQHILAQRVVVGDHSIHAEVGRVLSAAGEQAWIESWRQYLQQ